MLRHAIDEIFLKSIDYFLINNNKDSNKNKNTTTTTISTTTITNNTTTNNKLNSSVQITSILNNKESLYEQLDWFSSFKENSNLLIKNFETSEIVRKDSNSKYEEARYNTIDSNDLLNNFLHLRKNKNTDNTNSYEINFKNRKMTTINQNETEIDLVDSIQSDLLKTVKVFQKPYYQEKIKGENVYVSSWRMKEKMKTVSAALVLCLNIGVDPPDIVKTNLSSKIECWINQTLMTPQKALEMIGVELQKQYERWQPRARYKHCLDPTADDVKKLCISLRKNAKDDRILMHYNGHGVPKPTANGEIWVFNKEFTQYIPLSLYEVQTWMGSPSLYVWDCCNAGLIIQSFLQFEEDRVNEYLQRNDNASNNHSNNNNINTANINKIENNISENNDNPQVMRIRDSIHLAACGRNELLPMHPDLPLDLFTACLTTPIKAALTWYISKKNLSHLSQNLTADLINEIPGQINDRRTMMGELNWVFTAITDTIAWNVLDSELFQKLFRQDLLVASLFRNFLLAERIMKSLDCNPVSHPALPPTHEHPLWQSWDLALDMCISQLPNVLNGQNNLKQKDFVSCGFFAEQIEIFDVWLKYNLNSHNPPEQLPVVLQVLLSQQHRLKALELLGKFLDFGPWAVSAALSVGIFPYVVKLLTTQPKELRPLLTFIWAKILAVDKSCQCELVKDNGHVYFIHILADPDVESKIKVYAAFVLSCLVDNYPSGQESAKQNHLIAICSYLFTDKNNKDYKNPLLRQWCCICLGLCWHNYPEARWEGVRNNAHQYLIELICDPVPEVRAAAIFALSTYIGCGQGNEATVEQTNKLDAEIISALIKEYDIVYIVRKELISALNNYIYQSFAQSIINNQNNIINTSLNLSTASNAHEPIQNENSILISPTPKMVSSTQNLTTSSSTPQRSFSTSVLNKNLLPIHNNMTSNTSLNLTTLQELNLAMPNDNDGDALSLTQTKHTSNQTSLMSSKSFGSDVTSQNISIKTKIGRIKSVKTQSPMLINPTENSILTSSYNFNNIFNKVWSLLIELQNDPHPEVAELANKVVLFYVNQLDNFDSKKKSLILNTQHLILNQCLNSQNKQRIEKCSVQISTEFVPWCSKYFLRPLLTSSTQHDKNKTITWMGLASSSEKEESFNSSQVDVYGLEFLDQHCKLLYNHKIKRKLPNKWTEPQYMDETLQIKHNAYPIHCKFHPYEDQLFVVDKDNISVYETKLTNKLKLAFPIVNTINISNNYNFFNAKKTVVTSFKLINVQSQPLFLTATDDRVVRFFKPDLINYSGHQLITAFKAFGEKRPSNFEVGLIAEWEELNEILLCSGDISYIRLWNMSKELYKDFPTNASCCVSSLSTHDNYTAAGFGNGIIKLFDFRLSDSNVLTSSTNPTLINNHKSFCLKVQIHKPSHNIVSSNTAGEINLFDLRCMKNALKTTINNEPSTAIDCHPINELIAVANQNQTLKVFDFQGKELTCIKHHEGFLGKRIANVSCLDWNYHKNELVFGSIDNFLTIFTFKENN